MAGQCTRYGLTMYNLQCTGGFAAGRDASTGGEVGAGGAHDAPGRHPQALDGEPRHQSYTIRVIFLIYLYGPYNFSWGGVDNARYEGGWTAAAMRLEEPMTPQDAIRRLSMVNPTREIGIFCRTASASTAPCTSRRMCCPTYCASNCAPCRSLLRAFSGWIRVGSGGGHDPLGRHP